MKHSLPAIPLVVLSVTVPPTRHEPPDSMCSVRTLREQPGYQYTVQQIRQLVGRAEAIVRAEAVDSFRVVWANPPQPKDTPILEQLVAGSYDLIRFRTIEVLRWPDPAEVLGGAFPGAFTLRGTVVDTDDFNPLPVP